MNTTVSFTLETIQQEYPDLIAENDNVQDNYSFFRSFQKIAEGRARAELQVWTAASRMP
jgi:hypothetical protein